MGCDVLSLTVDLGKEVPHGGGFQTVSVRPHSHSSTHLHEERGGGTRRTEGLFEVFRPLEIWWIPSVFRRTRTPNPVHSVEIFRKTTGVFGGFFLTYRIEITLNPSGSVRGGNR